MEAPIRSPLLRRSALPRLAALLGVILLVGSCDELLLEPGEGEDGPRARVYFTVALPDGVPAGPPYPKLMRARVLSDGGVALDTISAEILGEGQREWTVLLMVPLPGEQPRTVTFEAELLADSDSGSGAASGASTQSQDEDRILWSAVVGPVQITSGGDNAIVGGPFVRGPPSNALVTGIEVELPPGPHVVGDIFAISARVSGGPFPSSPQVFFSALGSGGSLSEDGLATLTSTEPVSFVAAAGLHADTAQVVPLDRIADFLPIPGPIRLSHVGDQAPLSATVVDPRGNPVPDVALTWAVVSGSSVTIRDGNVVEAVSEGASTVEVSVAGRPNPRASVEVVVTNRVEAVTLEPDEVTLTRRNATTQVAAQAFGPGGVPMEGVQFTYTSSDPDIISVGSDGTLTAHAEGSVTVTASTPSVPALATPTQTEDGSTGASGSPDDSGSPAPASGAAGPATSTTSLANTDVVSASVTATARWVVTGIRMNPDSLVLVRGGQGALHATLLDEVGDTVTSVGRTIEWASADPNVAGVDGSGVVTAGGVGVTTVSAGFEGVSGEALVRVLAPPVQVTEMAFLSPPSSVTVGTPFTVEVEVRDAQGERVTGDVGRTITLSLVDEGIGAMLPEGGPTLQGFTSATTVGGVATFSNLVVTAAASAVKLQAEAGGLPNLLSPAFDAVATGGTVHWVAPTSGSWHDPENWSTGAVPGPGDEVIIEGGGFLEVTVSQPVEIASLLLDAAVCTSLILVIENGTFHVSEGGTSEEWARLRLTGGALRSGDDFVVKGGIELRNGAVRMLDGATLELRGWGEVGDYYDGGNITLEGSLVLKGSLSLNGTVEAVNAPGTGISVSPGGHLWFGAMGELRLPGIGEETPILGDVIINPLGSPTLVNEGAVNVSGIPGPGAPVEWRMVNRGELTVGDDTRLQLSGGFFQLGNDANLRGMGTLGLSGPGASDPLEGYISPGLSPGWLSIDGDLALASSGTLRMELGGSAPNERDRLVVNGELTLGGTLEVELINGYTPQVGDSAVLVEWTQGSGNFDTTIFPTPPSGAQWFADLRSDGILLELKALPTPTVTISPDTLTLTQIGDSLQATVDVKDEEGDPVVSPTITWAVADTLVAKVNADGWVTALNPGTTAVIAGFQDQADTAVVRVAPSGGVYWVNPAGGSWDVGANWHTGSTPAPGDSVFITFPGEYTVTLGNLTIVGHVLVGGASGRQRLSSGSQVLNLVGSLRVAENGELENITGSIAGSGDLIIGGFFDWKGSNVTGGGAFLVEEGGEVRLSGAISRILSGRQVENRGLISVDEGSLLIQNQAGILNEATGTLRLRGTGSFLESSGGSGTLTNRGTILRDEAGTTGLGFNYQGEGGHIRLDAGEILLPNGGTSTDSIHLAAGTLLSIGEEDFTLAPGGVVTGDGTLEVASGSSTFLVDGELSMGGLKVTSGTLDLRNSDPPSISRYLQTGGMLNVPGLIQVTDTLAWQGGAVTGGGALEVAAIGVGEFTGTDTKLLDGTTFRNRGTLTWTGVGASTSAVIIQGAALMENTASGSWTFDGPTSLSVGSGAPNFRNLGTLTRKGAGSESEVAASFVQDGAGHLQVDAGTLRLSGLIELPSGTRVGGDGTLQLAGSVQSYGAHITPGTATDRGILVVDGDLIVPPGESVAIRIGGTTPGTGYDRLQVTGALGASGDLVVTLVDGFVPSIGDTFQVVLTGSRTGAFSEVLPALPVGRFWDVSYTADGVTLEVVDSPPPE